MINFDSFCDTVVTEDLSRWQWLLDRCDGQVRLLPFDQQYDMLFVVEELREQLHKMPISALSYGIGFIQGMLIAQGITTLKLEHEAILAHIQNMNSGTPEKDDPARQSIYSEIVGTEILKPFTTLFREGDEVYHFGWRTIEDFVARGQIEIGARNHLAVRRPRS